MPLTPLVLFEHETIPFNWTDRDLRLLAAVNRQSRRQHPDTED